MRPFLPVLIAALAGLMPPVAAASPEAVHPTAAPAIAANAAAANAAAKRDSLASPAARADTLARAAPRADSSRTAADTTGAEPDTLAHAAAGGGVAPADTSLRITGTRLRFGYDVTEAARFGDFVVAASTFARPHEVARTGSARWFGLDSKATLLFRGGRLVRAHFEIPKPSPRDAAYVEDQLRSMGYHRKCTRDDPQASSCTWTGATRVDLDVLPGKLMGTIEPAPKPKPKPAPARPATPAPPELIVLGRPGEHPELPPAVVVTSPPPVYPAAAKKAKVQGNVWVRAQVDTSGAVTEAEVVKSIPELDAAALAAVRTWRFQRYVHDGRPARVSVDVPVKFVLH